MASEFFSFGDEDLDLDIPTMPGDTPTSGQVALVDPPDGDFGGDENSFAAVGIADSRGGFAPGPPVRTRASLRRRVLLLSLAVIGVFGGLRLAVASVETAWPASSSHFLGERSDGPGGTVAPASRKAQPPAAAERFRPNRERAVERERARRHRSTTRRRARRSRERRAVVLARRRARQATGANATPIESPAPSDYGAALPEPAPEAPAPPQPSAPPSGGGGGEMHNGADSPEFGL